MERAAVILAAGQGTRMKSSMPKVMHKVGGRAMVDWSIALARAVGCARIVVVCAPGQSVLQAHVTAQLGEGSVAIQEEPLGTGHAVRAAEPLLHGQDCKLAVMFGDTPLIQAEAADALFNALSEDVALGVLGFDAEDPGAYGRLITDADGVLTAIVEAKDASKAQLAIRYCNSGVMAGRASDLFNYLARVTNENANGEYYLTDVVGLAVADGKGCRAVSCAEADTLGVNTRAQLAEAEAAFQQRARAQAMANGVTMIAPETVFLSHDTALARDVTIEPHVVFGPGVDVAAGTHIRAFSHIEGARIATGCKVGPHARLRPGTTLETGAVVGNFVEVKNVEMGAGAKANHLSYLGDGEIGPGANIGAGTVFCNYDGIAKHRTVVEENAFIGSNSALVAPVRIGPSAMVGSGSVITDDVPGDALALGRGRQVVKPGAGAGARHRRSARSEEGE
ncbi:MAG: bifunctional UDP-N-acetylglucosamine diphosphorylase/glucosamine-1-phosphate N-acetyltransferase GlmU [Pseudomonadota bacterium]